MPNYGNRRNFLHTTMTAAASSAAYHSQGGLQASPPVGKTPVAFCLISDTHYLANSQTPSMLDEHSAQLCSRLITTINQLPGSAIPPESVAGVVQDFHGIIHAGDVIDSGDKRGGNYERMQRTEWDAYVADFGLLGHEGKLRFPIFEVHGNHDSPSGVGLAIDGMMERNSRRNCTALSANKLHCSWDWGPIHFINLGIVVGHDKSIAQRRRYNPMDSLEFLIGDLQQHARETNKPVIITHHVDVIRYSQTCDATNEKNLNMEWNPCDVQAYYRAIQPYNVLALMFGHTHVRNVQLWDGTANKTEQGFTLLNVDNASHFSGDNQAFFYIEISETRMLVRECATRDGWQTHYWSPMTWERPIKPA